MLLASFWKVDATREHTQVDCTKDVERLVQPLTFVYQVDTIVPMSFIDIPVFNDRNMVGWYNTDNCDKCGQLGPQYERLIQPWVYISFPIIMMLLSTI